MPLICGNAHSVDIPLQRRYSGPAWPSMHGEEKYTVLKGGPHVEMALLNVLGNWLDGSGWLAIMAASNVTREGKADALQSGSQTLTVHCTHQVTPAAALFCLQSQAFTAYTESLGSDSLEMKSFDEWCAAMESSYTQFFYWSKTLELEVLFLQFMQS